MNYTNAACIVVGHRPGTLMCTHCGKPNNEPDQWTSEVLKRTKYERIKYLKHCLDQETTLWNP